jgi:hypothetical protein
MKIKKINLKSTAKHYHKFNNKKLNNKGIEEFERIRNIVKNTIIFDKKQNNLAVNDFTVVLLSWNIATNLMFEKIKSECYLLDKIR